MVQIVHAVGQTLLTDAKKKVVVIAHQDVGEHVPREMSGHALDGEAEMDSISILKVDRSLVVPSGNDVMEARILVSQGTTHASTVLAAGSELDAARQLGSQSSRSRHGAWHEPRLDSACP